MNHVWQQMVISKFSDKAHLWKHAPHSVFLDRMETLCGKICVYDITFLDPPDNGRPRCKLCEKQASKT